MGFICAEWQGPVPFAKRKGTRTSAARTQGMRACVGCGSDGGGRCWRRLAAPPPRASPARIASLARAPLRFAKGASCASVQCLIAMIQSVKAIYRDGVLEPSESLDLEDGDVVRLSISVEGSAEDGDPASGDGNGVRDSASVDSKPTDIQALHEFSRKIRESVPESAWENVPRDGSINYKHYLYGHPKVAEE